MIYKTPRVTLLGHTSLVATPGMSQDPDATDSESLIEFAGRACYQSFDKPNPKTRSNPDYITNIIAQGHESVLEHATATFYIEGVSRNLTHELVRHRHLSYSQLSQRFVDESNPSMVAHPSLTELSGSLSDREIGGIAELLGLHYASTFELMQDAGKNRKQSREVARSYLPGMTETKIVVSGNYRAWRDFLKKRLSPAADAEIRNLAEVILNHLLSLAPSVFKDVMCDYYGED